MNDSIFALATAAGRSAIAVVRLSGPGVSDAIRKLGVRRVKPREAMLRRLHSPDGLVIDRGIVIWFPGPRSYTGEDCAELQVHGGPAVVARVMEALSSAGLRLANPGEFTRRAFENGRLDLGQAEAVADLIDAENDAQARQAVDQLEGSLGRLYRDWRSRLTDVMALLEAVVDFPEEDLPIGIVDGVKAKLKNLEQEFALALEDGRRGQFVREGYRIALIGAPNAGKSTLFNALLGRDAAIVAPTEGTTRDIIEAVVDLGGYRVILADMAGFRQSTDPVEAEGVRRARLWADTAALRVWVVDQSGDEDLVIECLELIRPKDVVLVNRMDLEKGPAFDRIHAEAERLGLPVLRSDGSKDGLAGVTAWLVSRLRSVLSGSDFPATTRLRHAEHLRDAHQSIVAAKERLDRPELAAEDVRLAARALSRVVGSIGVEEVLDGVFGNFCIGK